MSRDNILYADQLRMLFTDRGFAALSTIDEVTRPFLKGPVHIFEATTIEKPERNAKLLVVSNKVDGDEPNEVIINFGTVNEPSHEVMACKEDYFAIVLENGVITAYDGIKANERFQNIDIAYIDHQGSTITYNGLLDSIAAIPLIRVQNGIAEICEEHGINTKNTNDNLFPVDDGQEHMDRLTPQDYRIFGDLEVIQVAATDVLHITLSGNTPTEKVAAAQREILSALELADAKIEDLQLADGLRSPFISATFPKANNIEDGLANLSSALEARKQKPGTEAGAPDGKQAGEAIALSAAKGAD